MAPHRFHGYAPQGNGRERTYREIRVASLHHTGAGTRRDLVGITACHTIGQMDCPGHAFGGMVGRGYRKTLRETREAGRTRTPRTGGTRHAVHGLSHAAGYGIGDKADPGTAEGGEGIPAENRILRGVYRKQGLVQEHAHRGRTRHISPTAAPVPR